MGKVWEVRKSFVGDVSVLSDKGVGTASDGVGMALGEQYH